MHSSNTLLTRIGFDTEMSTSVVPKLDIIEFINMQLDVLGQPIFGCRSEYPLLQASQTMMARYRAKEKLQDNLQSPVDQRIQIWLNSYLGDKAPRLPSQTFELSQHGIARSLSLPPNGDEFHSSIISSYRVNNGVLHNPINDRRTTAGSFHVAEGGLPIPQDKKSVPLDTFSRLLSIALQPPKEVMKLPLTANQDKSACAWVSLLLRPVVCPEVNGFVREKSMEIRFFAPGNLVSNLDFVESIFGNAGDPYLLENDAGLDIDHWSGHTGCVILAPHLDSITKESVGLPHFSSASPRQRKDGMCWTQKDEKYNDGSPFKLTARNSDGVIITIISDNYFGYCKKEVKTQISFACNLMGLSEEEHAGGTLAFPSYDLGEDFRLNSKIFPEANHKIKTVIDRLGPRIKVQKEGHAIDQYYPDVIYVPENSVFRLNNRSISWKDPHDSSIQQKIKLLANKVYLLPSGYKVELSKSANQPLGSWKLIGTRAQPCMAHKPCTVSGGGKSEISKSIADAIIHAPFYVSDLSDSLDAVEKVLNHKYQNRFKNQDRNQDQRSLLDQDRSLGSVIQLLTPSDSYTDQHNAFIGSIPTETKELVLLLKRLYKPNWEQDWKQHFGVTMINGVPGHELRYRGRLVATNYLRVGYESDKSWRIFRLRKDFSPAQKIQTGDDITASILVPRNWLAVDFGEIENPSVKLVHNCEYRLFQRPDDAIIPGYDHQTEYDLSRSSNFLVNYEPIPQVEAKELIDDVVHFDQFTEPMKKFIQKVDQNVSNESYFCCSAYPKVIEGKPSENPRYLQNRLDLDNPRDRYVAEMGLRLFRHLTLDDPVHTPVDVVCPGRRNNPPEESVRCLAVFNPIHYLPLPEAFIEFISSMTGKSPSTTGAGSEGALTKGPFNALLPIHDLNAALLSYIISGYRPFVTASGYVGPNFRVDHDISLLVPEILCRMERHERDPEWLIKNRMLEPVPDLAYQNRTLPSSILGYRITDDFVNRFMARIFSHPSALFTESMLKPELQDLDAFAEGIDNVMSTHRRVAQYYFEDNSIRYALPPLVALLHIMKDGHYQNKTLKDPEVRGLFKHQDVIQSEWYQERLTSQQHRDIVRSRRIEAYLEALESTSELQKKKSQIAKQIEYFQSESYLKSLVGTIGRDPAL